MGSTRWVEVGLLEILKGLIRKVLTRMEPEADWPDPNKLTAHSGLRRASLINPFLFLFFY